jgi:hypothetical protein
MCLSRVNIIISAVTLNKLCYSTQLFLGTNLGSVKSQHQAISKTYKNGSPVQGIHFYTFC